MSELPLSRIITVTLLGTPQGLSNFNVNSLAIITEEEPNDSFGSDGYKIYRDPDAVATDFGTASETYEEAVAIFSQAPNILTGGGYLVVIPRLENASATAGTMLTLEPAELAELKTITDGAFTISVDGGALDITGLDFSGAADMDAVATLISDGVGLGATVTYDPNANDNAGGFLFTSGTTGASSKISKLSAPTGAGTDISGATYLNGDGNVQIINGQDALSTEDLVTAVIRAKGLVYFFGILITSEPTVEDALNLAGYVQTQDKLLFLGRDTEAEIETLFKVIQEATLTHTRCLYYTVGEEEARVMAAAYASRLFGINFNGSNTVSTMNLKTLAGISPDADAGTNNIDYKADLYGFDIYVSIAGQPNVLSYGANAYSDQIYCQLWLKLAMQVAGYNYLRTTNTKIPQTEPGMDGLKGAYARVCQQGITNGYMASGLTWTSPTLFGDPDDLRRNITDAGYYIYSQPIAAQDPADRADRIAPIVQIAAKEAGAVHHSDVIVQVN